ncbi:MAG: branched-chain amino acid ABC transporter substrate-binding protein [Chloroflexi bacterium]|nr:branched-chain amino acid ABC transporter substrate-binding protein [Chloroflexota bacterium]OQA95106.1 MAG: Leucine-, isoleucine-, valine-, threonine-, and alanine-binding protein precursor [Chloroflexi bacterium ADurb.Bin222]
MFKRILASVFILGGMLLSLAGCGGEETIKIGLQGPMTGDYAYEGKGFKNALTMLVEQVNAAGGINGKQVELLVEDDAGDPTQSALVAQRLVDAKVVAVIGAYNSTATEPASEIYNEAGILHITPSSTAVRLTTKGFPRFFRVCFLDDRQGLFAVKFMKEVLGAQNIGILHDNSTYAQGLAEETRRYAEEMGLKVGFYDAINPNDQDFTPILAKIGAANLDAVYFTGYHSEAGLLLKQSAELGLEVQWLGGNAANNPVMVEIAGIQNAAGMFVTTEPLPQDLNYPEARKFVADYMARYGEEPASVWTIMAGEAFNVIRIAMEQTQSTDPGVLADYIHHQLKNVNGLTGPILGFDEKGDRLGTIHVAYVIDDKGNFVLYDKQPSP